MSERSVRARLETPSGKRTTTLPPDRVGKISNRLRWAAYLYAMGYTSAMVFGNLLFFGLGEEQSHKTSQSIDTDHPEIFAAPDNGPTPVEVVLMGLAGCLTGGVASVAQNRGIQLRSVKATVEGDMNMYGILGIDPDVRNGYSNVRVRYEIDADASQEDIAAVVAQSQKRSAVFDIITNPTNVQVEVA